MKTEGCHAWDENGESRCHCQEEKACTALGGRFHTNTCGEELNHWDEGGVSLKKAEKAGTCDKVRTTWGEPLERAAKHLAQKCCKSFPKSICNPEGEVHTPCVDQGDFDPDAVANQWCNLRHANPSKDACKEEGCHTWDENGVTRCHCEEEDACKTLGGKFNKQTCGQELNHWDEGGVSLRKAKKKGTCDKVRTSWGESLERASKHLAQKCCKSFPRSLCNPEGTIPHPCTSQDQFDPDATMNEWCHLTKHDKKKCDEAKCQFWPGELENGHCYCSDEDSCKKAKGKWKRHSCLREMLNFDDGGKSLKAAKKQGKCDGIKTEWMEPLHDAVRWRASKCCKNAPKSICDP